MQRQSDLDRLARDSAWARRLARRLVGNEHDAEDVVQEAWVAALERPEPTRGSFRAWLGGVMRNLVRQRRRGDLRRADREERAYTPEARPPAADVVVELTAQRTLVDTLLSLDEPFRTVLLERFYRGRSLKRIALDQGVPVSTVHGWIDRGLARLRRQLDRSHGKDRRTWAVGMAALARGGGWTLGPLALPLSIMTMTMTKLAAAAGVVVLGSVVGIWMVNRSTDEVQGPPQVQAAKPGADLSSTNEPDPLVAVTETTSERTTVTEAREEVAEEAPAKPAFLAPRFEGFVFRGANQPVPGVRIVMSPSGAPKQEAVTNAAGRFELELPVEPTTIMTDDPVYTTLLPGLSPVSADGIANVVVGERAPIGGLVINEAGEPLEGARVRVIAAEATYRAFRRPHAYHDPIPGREVYSDVEGRFFFDDVAPGEWGLVMAELDGYVTAREPLPPAASDEFVLTLLRPEEAIWGRVIGAHGEGVEGAYVSLGTHSVITDIDGAFHLDSKVGRVFGEKFTTLRAVKEGLLPAMLEDALEQSMPLLLQMSDPPLSLSGRVVDGEGQARAGVILFLIDRTPLGHIRENPTEESAIVWRLYLEDAMVGDIFPQGATTDREGRFELRGLLDRDYRVACIEPGSAASSEVWSLTAGSTGHELVFPRSDTIAHVAGRVVSLSGNPLEGVEVMVTRELSEGSWYNLPKEARAAKATTNAEGRFDFEALDIDRTSLTIWDRQIVQAPSIPLAEESQLDNIEIRVPIRCDVQVDLSDRPDLAVKFRVLDAEGELAELHLDQGNVSYFIDEAEIAGSRSQVVGVPENSVTIVLLDAVGGEVARLPISPDPAKLTIVRP